MDQPFYWDNTHLNSADSQIFPDYLFSPSNSDMDYNNVAPQDNEGLSIGSHNPNSGEFPENQGNRHDARRVHVRNTALSINSSADPMIEEMQLERTSMLSLGNMDINLNYARADEEQSLPQALNSCNLSQSLGSNTYDEISETSMPPHIQETSELGHASSNSNWSSSSGVGIIIGDGDGRTRCSLYHQHVSSKRKNIEGVIGESSASGASLLFQQNESNSADPSSLNHDIAGSTNASGSSRYFTGANSFVGQLNRTLSTREGGAFSEWHQSSSFAGNAETSQRNFRVRLNPKGQHDVFPSDSHSTLNSIRLSSTWSHGEPSSFSPLNQLPECQQSVPPIPCLPGHIFPSLNGASSSRAGNSSCQSNSEKRLTGSCEEANTRGFQIFAGTNSSHVTLVPSKGNPSNLTVNMRGNEPIASIASGSSLLGLIKGPHENASVHYLRSFSNSSVAPGEPESGHERSNLSTQYMVQSASLHDSGQTSGGDPPGGSELHTRLAAFMVRQREVRPDIPLSMRSRERRDRMIIEIRNALDLMHRAENLRSVDAVSRDQSAFFRSADLHDRHRDMRLDVDNMSYEELLALGDRIGYVSTGLTEVAILQNLKQHKHSPYGLELAYIEQEPCCICRENYSEGEDIGKLGCSHDFHTACIKQWLMIKNLCPICRTTALET